MLCQAQIYPFLLNTVDTDLSMLASNKATWSQSILFDTLNKIRTYKLQLECCSLQVNKMHVKSVYQKNIFLISQPKHMLWVLKKPSHWDSSFKRPKHVKTDGLENIYNFTLKWAKKNRQSWTPSEKNFWIRKCYPYSVYAATRVCQHSSF